MTPHTWPHPQTEVAYFRDGYGTWFAAEVARARRWSGALLAPPDGSVADIRIAFLDAPSVPTDAARPPWLAVLAATQELDPALVVRQAMLAWPGSPHYRGPGASPEEFVVAGFQALCPPHPPCEPGPTARESLSRFLRERPGIMGDLGEEGRDAFNRSLRVYWETPERFADAILRERIRDEGYGGTLDLAGFLTGAPVSPEGGEFADLAMERVGLEQRLRPERFFTDAGDYDRAVVEARDWVDRYQRAYAQHYGMIVEAARATLAEVAPALEAAGELDSLNQDGRAVGADAVHRLTVSVTELRALPEQPEPGLPVTGGVTLGRIPVALPEARLAAAAVLASLDIQRRRASASSRHG